MSKKNVGGNSIELPGSATLVPLVIGNSMLGFGY